MMKYDEWKNKNDNKEVLEDDDDNSNDDDDDSDDDTSSDNEDVDEKDLAKALTEMRPEDVLQKWRLHLYNVEITRNMKSYAKSLSKENKEYVYCCFDLQQVLECPFSNVGDLFYKRTLSSYNFVVNDGVNAYCYYWSEDEGGR